jgi:hypothetical protein
VTGNRNVTDFKFKSGLTAIWRSHALVAICLLTACSHRPVKAPTLAARHCADGYTPHRAMYNGQLIDVCVRHDAVSGMDDVRVPGEIPGDADEPDEGKKAEHHWYCRFIKCKE